MKKESNKFNDLRRRDFDLGKIQQISDVPTWIAESQNSFSDSNDKEVQSYIDEVEFAPNEEIKNLILNRETSSIPYFMR